LGRWRGVVRSRRGKRQRWAGTSPNLRYYRWGVRAARGLLDVEAESIIFIYF
jgi:hypothetical protein